MHGPKRCYKPRPPQRPSRLEQGDQQDVLLLVKNQPYQIVHGGTAMIVLAHANHSQTKKRRISGK
jgi:hypothetical protein